MDDSDHMRKLVGPSRAMVEPGEMLWLLQNRQIGFFAVRNHGGQVCERQNRTLLGIVLSRIKDQLEFRLKPNSGSHPVQNILFLIFFRGKSDFVGIHFFLVLMIQPRHQQTDKSILFLGQVSSTKQWIHGGSRHPWQHRCCHNGYATAPVLNPGSQELRSARNQNPAIIQADKLLGLRAGLLLFLLFGLFQQPLSLAFIGL
mmetsp:Transcript_3372/g.5932  ORF Transcript_3372/g.5932 Transcript_3372/m.5932 type:complete len:201 (-) Transcript_3372:15-617(-)